MQLILIIVIILPVTIVMMIIPMTVDTSITMNNAVTNTMCGRQVIE